MVLYQRNGAATTLLEAVRANEEAAAATYKRRRVMGKHR